MASNATNGLVGDLQAEIHRQLAGRLPDGPFALVDFPDHSNVGDSAIWLGEVAYLRTWQGRAPAYVSSYNNFDSDRMERRLDGGAILLHGGGNFGDTWLKHQEFREHLIETFRDRPIIQMPQSIHYGDEAAIARTARLIARHPNFFLLVRDQPSFDLATRHFQCDVRLCPDMAFGMGSRDPDPAQIDVLALLRTDSERVIRDDDTGTVPVEDWLVESRIAVRNARILGRARAVAALRPGAVRLSEYQRIAELRVQRGLRQLAKGRAVVTDRLHAHILSLLLGIPHAVLDNSYGKIGRFLDAFSGGSNLVMRANSAAEAIEWARAAAAKAGR